MHINTTPVQAHPFTQRLADIARPPRRLCYLGQLPDRQQPVVAIVGSRKPTGYGKDVTQWLASALARRGCVIVSGLALGVDCIAQQAALDAGGTVVGVVTSELPDITPHSNRPLAERIIQHGGTILSEWMRGDGIRIKKWSFLERNRLVSGLADAVIITEAAARSGTLNTAAHALSQGRDVFVVPGNITSPLSAGCNALIKQGAQPITDPRDVLESFRQFTLDEQPQQATLPLSNTPAEATILQLLSSGVRDGEQLQQQSGLSPADFATALTMLEMNGLIKPLGANNWART